MYKLYHLFKIKFYSKIMIIYHPYFLFKNVSFFRFFYWNYVNNNFSYFSIFFLKIADYDAFYTFCSLFLIFCKNTQKILFLFLLLNFIIFFYVNLTFMKIFFIKINFLREKHPREKYIAFKNKNYLSY